MIPGEYSCQAIVVPAWKTVLNSACCVKTVE